MGFAATMGRLARPRLDCMNLRTASNTFELPFGRLRACNRPLTHLRRHRRRHCPPQTRSKEKWSAAGKCLAVHQPFEQGRGARWRMLNRRSACVNLLLMLDQRRSWGRSCWCCSACGQQATQAPRRVRWEEACKGTVLRTVAA